MAYGMKTVRKAGQNIGKAILDADEKYADAAAAASPTEIGKLTSGVNMREIIDNVTAPSEAETAIERAAEIGLRAGIPAANLASRYALPLGGVTLAGKGLIDLTAIMQGQSSGELAPT